MDGCWKSCHVEASDKITLTREVHFLLKSGFQVITFTILLEVGYLIKIVGNFIYKWAQNLVLGHCKIISDWYLLFQRVA